MKRNIEKSKDKIVIYTNVISLIIGILASIIFWKTFKLFLILSIPLIVLSIFTLFVAVVLKLLTEEVIDNEFDSVYYSYSEDKLQTTIFGIKYLIILITITIITIFLMILSLII